MNTFHFKEFKIHQEKTSMKVGTDGVLLGAWTDIKNSKSILDIGSGTGLISLMLAQKTTEANIIALEIEKNAFLQTKENFINSPWDERLTAINIGLQDFNTKKKFDLIVSNPPYFNNSFRSIDKSRNTARQTSHLSFEDLIFHSSRLLSKEGSCSYIIPFSEETNLIEIADSFHLHINRIQRIKGNPTSKLKRSLLEFGFKKENIKIEKDLTIELERHVYTEKYTKLTKAFYLKM